MSRELTLRGLTIRGALPAELDGVYLRNGPNPRFRPLSRQHWFDGEGMVHWLRLRGGRGQSADYGARFVRTRGFEEESAAGAKQYVSITDPPLPGYILRGLASKAAHALRPDTPYWVVQQYNVANNGVTFHAGRLLATYEVGCAYELRLEENLSPVGPCDFGGSWSAADFWTENFTAHPKADPATGSLLYCGYNLIPLSGSPSVTVGEVGPDGRIAARLRVASRGSLQHDMAITATRVVLLDGPLLFDLAKSVAGRKPFNFVEDAPMRFGLLQRSALAASAAPPGWAGGAPRAEAQALWVEAETGYSYHVVNAWDDPVNPDRVVLYTCRLPGTRALGMADPARTAADGSAVADDAAGMLPYEEAARLHRYVLDAVSGTLVESTPWGPEGLACDFPAVNPRVVGRPCRFAWAALARTTPPGSSAVDPITMFDGVVRLDLCDAAGAHTQVRRFRPGVFCGDVVFVPRAEGVAEDDGFVLVLTHDVATGTAELLVLDGASVDGAPLAAVEIPVRVPFGFHATFVEGGWAAAGSSAARA